jgi:SAM-dependent methyltransferase
MVWGWWSFAPWVPSNKKDYKRIFKLANLEQDEVFYDLGCGTGRLVLYANKNFQAKTIGLEVALPLFLMCKVRQLFNSNSNIVFKFKNLYKEDLSQADVIYFFGIPETVNSALRQKLEKEAKKGARIISYVFQIRDWFPQVIDKPTENDKPIYLYIK